MNCYLDSRVLHNDVIKYKASIDLWMRDLVLIEKWRGLFWHQNLEWKLTSVASNPSAKPVSVSQYPLYIAMSARDSGVLLPYYFDDAAWWATVSFEIQPALENAKDGHEANALGIIDLASQTPRSADPRAARELCTRRTYVSATCTRSRPSR
jgi:hypothetical protein